MFNELITEAPLLQDSLKQLLRSPREVLIKDTMLFRKQCVDRYNDKHSTFYHLKDNNSIASLEVPIQASLTELNRLCFDDLTIGSHHDDGYLLCRVVTLAYRIVGVTFVVEDINGIVSLASIYNLSLESTLRALDAKIQPGKYDIYIYIYNNIRCHDMLAPYVECRSRIHRISPHLSTS